MITLLKISSENWEQIMGYFFCDHQSGNHYLPLFSLPVQYFTVYNVENLTLQVGTMGCIQGEGFGSLMLLTLTELNCAYVLYVVGVIL